MVSLEVTKDHTQLEKTRMESIHRELAWNSSHIHVLQMYEFVLHVNSLTDPTKNTKTIEIMRKVLKAFRNDTNEVVNKLKS